MMSSLFSKGIGLVAMSTSDYVMREVVKSAIRMPRNAAKRAAIEVGTFAISTCLSATCADFVQKEINEIASEVKKCIGGEQTKDKS